MFKVDVDFAGIDAALDEITEAAHDAVRPAAQAGAQIFYTGARLRAPVSEAGWHWFYGTSYKLTGQKYGPYQPGSLRNAIYQVYSKDNSSESRAEYQISWNHNPADPRSVPYGFMVEFGTATAPAHSFIRASYEAYRQAAAEATRAALVRLIRERLAS